jgi:hypothetical protein
MTETREVTQLKRQNTNLKRALFEKPFYRSKKLIIAALGIGLVNFDWQFGGPVLADAAIASACLVSIGLADLGKNRKVENG